MLRFVGDAFGLGDGLVRPHEVVLHRWPGDGAVEVEVERIVVLGADARIELADGGGERMTARLRREEVDDLELAPGEIVWARAEPLRGLASAGDAEAAQALGWLASTSTRWTSAPRGPAAAEVHERLDITGSPSKTASTVPSARFRTQPDSPRAIGPARRRSGTRHPGRSRR